MRIRHLISLVILGLGAIACTEDSEVITDLGTLRLQFIDPGLSPQQFKNPDDTLQVAEWSLDGAIFNIDGVQADLLFGEKCGFVDTVVEFPATRGICVGSLIVDAIDEPRPVSLDLSFVMSVRRAKPLELLRQLDEDGDGVANGDDNCPLVPNPNQSAEKNTGFGDACSFIDPLTLAVRVDSDMDGTFDSFDNCLWKINKSQKDTGGLSAEGLIDLIGDACEEQVARVQLPNGDTKININVAMSDFIQPLNQLAALTVDFSDAVSCDWIAQTCTLVESNIKLCVGEALGSGGC